MTTIIQYAKLDESDPRNDGQWPIVMRIVRISDDVIDAAPSAEYRLMTSKDEVLALRDGRMPHSGHMRIISGGTPLQHSGWNTLTVE